MQNPALPVHREPFWGWGCPYACSAFMFTAVALVTVVQRVRAGSTGPARTTAQPVSQYFQRPIYKPVASTYVCMYVCTLPHERCLLTMFFSERFWHLVHSCSLKSKHPSRKQTAEVKEKKEERRKQILFTHTFASSPSPGKVRIHPARLICRPVCLVEGVVVCSLEHEYDPTPGIVSPIPTPATW